MPNHSFVNEDYFYNYIKSSIHYRDSVMIQDVTNHFLEFVFLHHFSIKQEYIKILDNKQYSCVLNFIDGNKTFQYGIKYVEQKNKTLKIIKILFGQL